MKRNKLFTLLISLSIAIVSLLGLLWWLESVTLITQATPIVHTYNQSSEAIVEVNPNYGKTNNRDLNVANQHRLIFSNTV